MKKIIGIILVSIMSYGVINKLYVDNTLPKTIISKPVSIKPISRLGLIALSKAIRPLRALGGRRYCSSSVMNHRGRRYTVTNRHCCEAQLQDGMREGYRQVGDTLEKIILVSQASDLCVLSTNHRYGLNLAKNGIKQFEKTIIIGFPAGDPLTMYEGHFQYDKQVCIEYAAFPLASDVRCVRSNVHSTTSWPGNSGSAMFNKYGYVIGVLYGGSRKSSVSVTLGQLRLALDTARALERKERYGKNK